MKTFLSFGYEKEYCLCRYRTTVFDRDIYGNRIMEKLYEVINNQDELFMAVKTICNTWKPERDFAIVEIEGYKAVVWAIGNNENEFEDICYPFDKNQVYPLQKIKNKLTWY